MDPFADLLAEDGILGSEEGKGSEEPVESDSVHVGGSEPSASAATEPDELRKGDSCWYSTLVLENQFFINVHCIRVYFEF